MRYFSDKKAEGEGAHFHNYSVPEFSRRGGAKIFPTGDEILIG